jgi:hypothetical protein
MPGSLLLSPMARHKANNSAVVTEIFSCWKKPEGNPARLKTAGTETSCSPSRLARRLETLNRSLMTLLVVMIAR